MKRRARKSGGKQLDVSVESVGARGDGLAKHPETGVPIFVPFSLPGERLTVRLAQEKAAGVEAEALSLIDISDQRQDAACSHFGQCGGCQLQHWEQAGYQKWEQERLAYALIQAGFDNPKLRPLISSPGANRRRAAMNAEKDAKGQVSIGFRARASHQLISLQECMILKPEIFDALQPLREFCEQILEPKQSCKLHLTWTDAGLDLLVHHPDDLDSKVLLASAALTEAVDLARLFWNKEKVLERRAPHLQFGELNVGVPPGAFLQACAEIQSAMTQTLVDAVPDSTDLAVDLYSGLGSFSLPLLAKAKRVLAVDAEGAASAAMTRALKGTDQWNRTEVVERDLERWPMSAQELSQAGCIVFDPPRAGAKNQAPEIAKSGAPLVFAISCNLPTFTRDIKHLQQAGYKLKWAQAFDQFLWSAHLEVMACFELPAND